MFERWKAKWGREQLKKHRKFLDEIRTQFVAHLLKKEPTLVDAFSKQTRILNGRKVITICITEKLYRTLLQKFVTPIDVIDDIVDTIKVTGEPVGYWVDIPIYMNHLLQKAPIFVVGEITWEL